MRWIAARDSLATAQSGRRRGLPCWSSAFLSQTLITGFLATTNMYYFSAPAPYFDIVTT